MMFHHHYGGCNLIRTAPNCRCQRAGPLLGNFIATSYYICMLSTFRRVIVKFRDQLPLNCATCRIRNVTRPTQRYINGVLWYVCLCWCCHINCKRFSQRVFACGQDKGPPLPLSCLEKHTHTSWPKQNKAAYNFPLRRAVWAVSGYPC